jgi:hypothetical protein
MAHQLIQGSYHIYQPTNTTAPAREIKWIQHKEHQRIHDININMDNALKAQVIDTIDDTYICELCIKYKGYLVITTWYLINHLLDWYGKITPADIEDCKCRMNEPIATTQPIDIFFQWINDCVQYANVGQVASTGEQILRTAYHAVSTLGH